MASRLLCSNPDPAVRVRSLVGSIEHWARHFTLTLPFSTLVYKWIPANFWVTVITFKLVTIKLFKHKKYIPKLKLQNYHNLNYQLDMCKMRNSIIERLQRLFKYI